MATPQDYQKYKELWPQWARRGGKASERVLMCSPDSAQFRLAQLIFPNAKLMQRSEAEWDLNRPWSEEPVDILIVCGVFQYSGNPGLWFTNCFRACRYLWLQDIIARPRGTDNKREFSVTDSRDCQRYRFGDNLIPSGYAAFDLLTYRERLLAFEIYDAGSLAIGKTLLNFMVLFEGDAE